MRVELVGLGYWGTKMKRVIEELGHDVCPLGRGDVPPEGFDAEACVITTPPSTHADIAIRAMKRGLDVLIEKPMALNVEDATKIENAAHMYGRVVSVDSTWLHTQAFEYIKELDEPLIFYQSLRMAPHIKFYKTSVIWDAMAHDLAILSALHAVSWSGKPVAVQSYDAAIAYVPLFIGGNAFITVSRDWPMKYRQIQMRFANGTSLYWDDDQLYQGGKLILSEKHETLKRMFKDFERRCKNRERSGLTDALHGLGVVSWLEKMLPLN